MVQWIDTIPLGWTVIKVKDENEELEYIRNQYEKSFNASFKNVDDDFSSKNLLNKISKNDIYNIAQNLELEKVSTLRKNKLIETLDNYILSNFTSIFSDNLNMAEYNLIKKLIKNRGIIDYHNTDANYELIMALRDLGLVFPIKINDVKKVCLPENYIEKLDDIYNNLIVLSYVKEHDRLFKLVYAMLYYYGVMEISVLQEKLALLTNTDIDEYEMFRRIINHQHRYGEIRFENSYFIFDEVYDANHIINEQMSRSDVDFLELDERALLSVSEKDFCGWNNYDIKMFEYLSGTIDATKEEVSEIVDTIINMIKNDIKLTAIVQRLCERIIFDSDEQLEVIVGNVSNMNNNCRMWVLKGHSPNEIPSGDIESSLKLPSKSVKIGRNAQCPCGSGKKYKNCCGIFEK